MSKRPFVPTFGYLQIVFFLVRVYVDQVMVSVRSSSGKLPMTDLYASQKVRRELGGAQPRTPASLDKAVLIFQD